MVVCRLFKRAALLFVIFLLLIPQLVVEVSAASSCTQTNWLDPAFIYRKRIVFDNSSATDALSSFPVMVKLTSSNFEFFKARPNGGDIRFTDSDGTTQLSYEIEKWDSATSDAVIWVTVPQIDAASSSDYIYMYFGNQNASTTQTAATGGVVRDSATARAAWPLDETTTTQSYSRVINPAVATGRNMVLNGTFDDSSQWSPQAGFAISGGTGNFTAASTLVSNGAPIVAGKVYAMTYTISNYSAGSFRMRAGSTGTGTNRSADGTYTDTVVAAGTLNFYLDPTGFTGSVDNVTATQLNIPANTATSATQLLTDGDMETSGTSSWTAGSSANLSKQTTDPHSGTQLLRVTRNGVNNPTAEQASITTGQVYRATGYVRSDGTAVPRIGDLTKTLFTGTTSTTWQPFDVVFVAGSNTFDLQAQTSTGTTYAEFDDVVVSADNYIRQGELLQDGDMETSGTGVWTSQNAAVVSKQTTSPHGGSQVLRVARNGTNLPFASQSVISLGKTYRYTGYFRSDGNALPRVGDGGNIIVTGTTDTNWQFFDITIVAITTSTARFYAITTIDGQYAEFDDVSVTEVDPLIGKVKQYDASGNLLTTNPTLGSTANGHLTNAYSFDGSNDVVNIYSSDLNSVFNPSEGTMIAWAKVSGAGVWTDGANRYIGQLQADGNNELLIQRTTTNNQLQVFYIAGGTSKTVTDTSLGGTTNWFQVVITWSKSSDQFKFYINGAQVGSTQTGLGTWVGNLTATPARTVIGAQQTSGTNPWSGMINDVRLYNSALSPSLISAYYKSGADTFNTINAEEGYKASCDAASAPPPPSVAVTPTPTATVRPIPFKITTTVPATTQPSPLGPTGTAEPTPAPTETPTSEPVTFKLPEIKFPRISFSLPQIQLPDLRPFFNSIGYGIASAWNGYMNLATALSSGTRDLASVWGRYMSTAAALGSGTRDLAAGTINSLVSIWEKYSAGSIALSKNTTGYIAQSTQNFITMCKRNLDNSFNALALLILRSQEAIEKSLQRPRDFLANLGDWLTSFNEIVLDREPTKITEVKATQISPTSTVIIWKTNHKSNSKVNYGETLDYGRDVQSKERVYDHAIQINNLKPNTKYYYEVMSQGKNYVYDAHHEFVTPSK